MTFGVRWEIAPEVKDAGLQGRRRAKQNNDCESLADIGVDACQE
jgi:hypothetical protein